MCRAIIRSTQWDCHPSQEGSGSWEWEGKFTLDESHRGENVPSAPFKVISKVFTNQATEDHQH